MSDENQETEETTEVEPSEEAEAVSEAAPVEESADAPAEEEKESPEAIAGHLERACVFVDNVLRLSGFEANAQASFDGHNVLIAIDGPDAKSLIVDEKNNYKPELSDAIADLTRRVIGERHSPPVVVDAANQRGARLEKLEVLAGKLATAVRNGQKLDVFGLDSVERRTVHRHLAEEDGLSSNSDGFGIYRRLTIRAS